MPTDYSFVAYIVVFALQICFISEQPHCFHFQFIYLINDFTFVPVCTVQCSIQFQLHLQFILHFIKLYQLRLVQRSAAQSEQCVVFYFNVQYSIRKRRRQLLSVGVHRIKVYSNAKLLKKLNRIYNMQSKLMHKKSKDKHRFQPRTRNQ